MSEQGMAGIYRALLFCLMLFTTASVSGQDATTASITIEMQFRPDFLDSIDVQLLCSFTDHRSREFKMAHDERREIVLEGIIDTLESCQARVLTPVGYSATYIAQGESVLKADDNGCQFSRMSAGQVNSCLIDVTQNPVMLTVYKKWIGGSGEEEDVQVSLECENGDYSGYRYINEGSPDGWEISQFDPEGILCNVTETVRDTFRPDIIDCQGLYIRPGRGEECTLINTKIVKRIEMLNRYGKIVMIVLVLAVGLVAVRRLT